MTHPNDDPGKPMTDAFLRSCTDEQLVALIWRTSVNPDTLQDVANEVAKRFAAHTDHQGYTLCGKVLHPLNVNPCDRVAGHEGACVVRWKYVAPARVTEHELTD